MIQVLDYSHALSIINNAIKNVKEERNVEDLIINKKPYKYEKRKYIVEVGLRVKKSTNSPSSSKILVCNWNDELVKAIDAYNELKNN